MSKSNGLETEQYLTFLKMKKINADTLLEGMFGQTAGISETVLIK